MIAQQLAERMPEIVRAAAEPFAHVGQLTVLNGAEGLNGMVAGIMAQVGTLLPQLTSALGKKDQPAAAGTNGSRPVPKAVADGVGAQDKAAQDKYSAARNQQ